MARQLKLDIHAAPKAFRDRLTARYKLMGLDLIWTEIDGNTNRVQKEVSDGPRRRYDKKKMVKEKTCLSCGVRKLRSAFSDMSDGRPNLACIVCMEASERTCRKCKVIKPIEDYWEHSPWTCKACKEEARRLYSERKAK